MANGPTAGTYPVRQWSDPTGNDPDPAALDLSRLVNEWLEKNGPDGMFKMCANCRHMEKIGPVFCAFYNAVPPTPVFLRGCDQHKDVTEIPF